MAVKYDSECAAVGRCLIFAEKEALVLSSLFAGLQNLKLQRKNDTETVLLGTVPPPNLDNLYHFF